MVEWHHQLNGHEFEQNQIVNIVKDREAQCTAIHGVAKSHTWLSNQTTTELKKKKKKSMEASEIWPQATSLFLTTPCPLQRPSILVAEVTCLCFTIPAFLPAWLALSFFPCWTATLSPSPPVRLLCNTNSAFSMKLLSSSRSYCFWVKIILSYS